MHLRIGTGVSLMPHRNGGAALASSARAPQGVCLLISVAGNMCLKQGGRIGRIFFSCLSPAFPLGNRCAVAPVCAPGNEAGRQPGKRWLRQWAFSGGRGWYWKRHCSDFICFFADAHAHTGQYLPRSKKIQVVAVFLL